MPPSRPLTGVCAILSASFAFGSAQAEPYAHYLPVDGTYSIIAVDPETGQLGMGVQSKALSVGNRTITGKGGVAMVAHQSSSNPMYGTVVIDAIERGMSPEQALEFAKRADETPERRQVAVIDIEGRSAAWTSPDITEWKGHACAPTYCVQGNTLTGPEVIEAMAVAFEGAEGPLAERLMAALDAGQAAGGDWRGMQGAALQIVYPLSRGDFDDRLLDIRVDDHREPLVELRRIYGVTRAQEIMGDEVNAAMASGDLDAALAAAKQANALSPTSDMPLLAMAEVALLKGDMDGAVETISAAIDVNEGVKAYLARNDRFDALAEDARFQALVAQD